MMGDLAHARGFWSRLSKGLKWCRSCGLFVAAGTAAAMCAVTLKRARVKYILECKTDNTAGARAERRG